MRGIYKFPSAYFVHNEKMIKVLETHVVEGAGAGGAQPPGEFVAVDKEGITVACGVDCLKIVKIKPEGKGEMFARDWYNGLKNK